MHILFYILNYIILYLHYRILYYIKHLINKGKFYFKNAFH